MTVDEFPIPRTSMSSLSVNGDRDRYTTRDMEYSVVEVLAFTQLIHDPGARRRHMCGTNHQGLWRDPGWG